MKEYKFFVVLSKDNEVKGVLMSSNLPEAKDKSNKVLEITLNTYIQLSGW